MTGRLRLQFPHPLVLLFGIAILAALMSYALPAGEYERRVDDATGRTVVVAGLTFPDWFRFVFRLYLGLVALGAVAIAIALAIGL